MFGTASGDIDTISGGDNKVEQFVLADLPFDGTLHVGIELIPYSSSIKSLQMRADDALALAGLKSMFKDREHVDVHCLVQFLFISRKVLSLGFKDLGHTFMRSSYHDTAVVRLPEIICGQDKIVGLVALDTLLKTEEGICSRGRFGCRGGKGGWRGSSRLKRLARRSGGPGGREPGGRRCRSGG